MARRCSRCGKNASVRAHPRRGGIANANTGAPKDDNVNFDFAEEHLEHHYCSLDPSYTCPDFPTIARDPYWPNFAHPRWLSCRDLYCMK